MSPNSGNVTSTLHPQTRKSSYGRVIRESIDSSTYSYETSNCKKLRQHAYVSLKDSTLYSQFGFSPLTKARMSKRNSNDIPYKSKGKRKIDNSLVLNQPITPVSIRAFNTEESSIKSSIPTDLLEVSSNEDLVEAYPCQGNSFKTSSTFIS